MNLESITLLRKGFYMKKTCTKEIFKSMLPEEFNRKNRFDDHDNLQNKLIDICNNWFEYLCLYYENRHLLFNNEMPWSQNERVLVSTLAASIARSYPQALIMEELPVIKPAKPQTDQESVLIKGKKGNNGRCDLWASNLIFDLNEPLCFFLEAKKFRSPKQVDTIEKLVRDKGIGRIFDDYVKSLTGDKITQKSPYKSPSHYYAISMLSVPFICETKDISTIQQALDNIFNHNKSQKVTLKNKEKKRALCRFPTVALIVKPPSGYSGMVTIFTVLGEGKKTSKLYLETHVVPETE
jgi:hypothetical protein